MAVQTITSFVARAWFSKHLVGIVLLSVVLSGVDQWLAQWLIYVEGAWAFELVLTATIAFALVRFVRHLQVKSRRRPPSPPAVCVPPVANWARCQERPHVPRRSHSTNTIESELFKQEVELPASRKEVDEVDLEALARNIINLGGNFPIFAERGARLPERSSECVQAVIRACITAGETARGASWLEEMQQKGKMDAKTLVCVMDAFYLAGNATQAERLLSASCQSSLVDCDCFRTLFERILRNRVSILAWLQHATAAGVSTEAYGGLLMACALEEDTAFLKEWMPKAAVAGVTKSCMKTSIYVRFISEASARSQPEHAERWLQHMLADDVRPDATCWTTLLHAWATSGNAKKVEDVLHLMLNHGFEPDTMMLGTAVQACGKSGDAETAKRIFKMITGRGRARADGTTYNGLVTALMRQGDRHGVDKVLAEMSTKGIETNVVTHTTAMYAHARAGDVVAVERCLERMLGQGVEANVVTFGAVIHACFLAGDDARAQKWFDHLMSKDVIAGSNYGGLLNECMKFSKFNLVEQWFGVMVDRGVPLNVQHYNVVISACGRAGDAERAELWLRRLQAEPDVEHAEFLEPTCRSYTTAAKAYALRGKWQDTERIFADMESRGLALDAWGLSVLLSSYLRGRGSRRLPTTSTRARGEAAFRKHVAAGLEVTWPPLRALRGLIGKCRFEELCDELKVDLASVPE